MPSITAEKFQVSAWAGAALATAATRQRGASPAEDRGMFGKNFIINCKQVPEFSAGPTPLPEVLCRFVFWAAQGWAGCPRPLPPAPSPLALGPRFRVGRRSAHQGPSLAGPAHRCATAQTRPQGEPAHAGHPGGRGRIDHGLPAGAIHLPFSGSPQTRDRRTASALSWSCDHGHAQAMNPSEPGSLPLAAETPQQVSTSHFKAHALVVTDHGRPSIEAPLPPGCAHRRRSPAAAARFGAPLRRTVRTGRRSRRETLACHYWIPPC